MPKQYMNTDRTKTSANYIQVQPEVTCIEATFNVKGVSPNVSGKVVPMVNGGIRLTSPVSIDACDSTCPVVITESVEIKFNMRRGGDVNALRAEAVRLLDAALADYSLAYGVVPPATASFDVP